MSQNEFIALYEKYKLGNCSPAEKEFLENYKDDYVLEDLDWTPEMGDKAQINRLLCERLNQQIEPLAQERFKLKPMLRWISAAAVFLMISAAGIFFYQRKVDVSNDAIALVKFQTNKGEKKQITLSDGTKVWLNSLSALTLKNGFNEETREVNLTGEAYFDVTPKAGKPFKVHTTDFNINVLGTAFNVKAYPDDKTSETTLIRGLISLQGKANHRKRLIVRPSQKVVFVKSEQQNPSGKASEIQSILIKNYQEIRDTTILETAWTKNNLEIYNQKFIDIRKVLERWFDVHIVFKSEAVQQYKFTGTFTNESINEVLETLKKAGDFNYEIKEKTITISK